MIMCTCFFKAMTISMSVYIKPSVYTFLINKLNHSVKKTSNKKAAELHSISEWNIIMKSF